MEQDSPVGLRHIYSGHLLELKEVHRRVILNDMRKSLMKSLLQSGLCTKDIYSFVCTQADLCETLDSPDWTTVRSAMHNKIRDIQQTLKNEHRQRNKLEKKVLDLYGGRGWKLRQAIKTIKNDINNAPFNVKTRIIVTHYHYRSSQKTVYIYDKTYATAFT